MRTAGMTPDNFLRTASSPREVAKGPAVMQNTTDISALVQNTRNIYIAIAVLTVIVALGPSDLKMPAYLGVMGLVAWLLFLSITGKTARQFRVQTLSGVLSDVTPFPQARAVTIAGYPNSGTVDGATRFMVAGRPVYMKTLAPLKAGDVVVAAIIPNEDKSGPLASVAFEALALRDESRTDAEGRWLFIPDARMQIPSGGRLWAVVAISVLLIGFLFPIYAVVVIKRSYDIKWGWERANEEARHIVAPGSAAEAPANRTASELLA